MRPLRFFKNLEASPDQRGDAHEAVSGWHQPKDIRLEVAGIQIDSADMAKPLVFQELDYDETRILCLYACTTPAAGALEQIEDEVQIPAQVLEMGEWVVIIKDPAAFKQRFIDAGKRDDRNGRAKLVSYFDPETFSGQLDQPIFWKRKEFAHQREYRFALQPTDTDSEMLFFDVGDLSDICGIVPAQDMKRIEVRPR